jgi:hypothetical protein
MFEVQTSGHFIKGMAKVIVSDYRNRRLVADAI